MSYSNSLAVSSDFDGNAPPKKEPLTSKIRQTLNVVGRRNPESRSRKQSVPDLTNLTPQSQVNEHIRKEFVGKGIITF